MFKTELAPLNILISHYITLCETRCSFLTTEKNPGFAPSVQDNNEASGAFGSWKIVPKRPGGILFKVSTLMMVLDLFMVIFYIVPW